MFDEKRLSKCFLGVLAAHVLALLYLFFFGGAISNLPLASPPKLVVNTISLSAPEEKKLLALAANAEPFTLPEPEVVAPAPPPEPVAEEKKAPKEEPKPEPPKPEPIKKKEEKIVKKPTPQKVVKKTTPTVPAKPKKKEEKLAAFKPKPKTPEKKQPSKEQIAANEAKKKKQEQEAAKDAQKRQAIAKAQESLAKMQQCAGKMTNNINKGIPENSLTSIECLQIDTLQPLNNQEIGYRDALAIRLKKLLLLPEYGDVQLKLTLERSGKVMKVIIVKSKSDINRKYIEQTLPSLHFPSFGSNFCGSDIYTFLVNLTNDD